MSYLHFLQLQELYDTMHLGVAVELWSSNKQHFDVWHLYSLNCFIALFSILLLLVGKRSERKGFVWTLMDSKCVESTKPGDTESSFVASVQYIYLLSSETPLLL